MSRFLLVNPGLNRRITHRFNFPDYTADEIVAIFIKMCQKAEYLVKGINTSVVSRHVAEFGSLSTENAGFSSRLYKACITAINNRLTELITTKRKKKISPEFAMTITMADVFNAFAIM